MRRVPPLIVGLLEVTALCACSPDAVAPGGDALVTISVSGCGTGWTDTAAEAQHITLDNTDTRPGSAQLIRPRTGQVTTAVAIACDDSDGWYDLVFAPITNGSTGSQDTTMCSDRPTTVGGYTGRCGPARALGPHPEIDRAGLPIPRRFSPVDRPLRAELRDSAPDLHHGADLAVRARQFVPSACSRTSHAGNFTPS